MNNPEDIDPVVLVATGIALVCAVGWGFSNYRRGQEGAEAIDRSRQSYQDGRRDATSYY